MKIDIILEANNSPETSAELSRLAEGYGIGGVWVSNMHDGRDPFINFVETARTTRKIRLGPTAVSPYELHPLKMATALLTLNEIAKGRAQLGISAGGGGTATAMGVPQTRRLRAVRECVEILKAAGTGKPIRYAGEMYKVFYYHASWVSAPPPLVYVCANGPQMLRSAAKYAEGIMVGDHTPDHIAKVRAVVDERLQEAGRSKQDFRLNNFWAWHIKPTREEAEREARKWLAVRATPYPEYYYHDVLPEEELKIVWAHIPQLNKAFQRKTHVIEGIPEEIITRLVHRCTSAAGLDELDREIERLRQFRAAGLTDIALRVYDDPAEAIRIIGERVLPAL